MPNWSAGLCPGSVKCAPAAVTFGWQDTPRCSPWERPYMQPRESAPAVARPSNHIPMEHARCWVVMVAAPSTNTAPLAAAPTFVPKPGACTHVNTSLISSSASKLSTSALVAVVHVRWKLRSVPLWRKCDLKEPRNHAPASGWPQTASPAGRAPRRHSAASSAPRSHRPAAQTQL